MLNQLEVKEGIFRLEISQSQYSKEFYFVVIFKCEQPLCTQEFDNLTQATKEGREMLKAIVNLAKYRDLADTAQQQAIFAKEDGELIREAMFIEQAKFYEQQYRFYKSMTFWLEKQTETDYLQK